MTEPKDVRPGDTVNIWIKGVLVTGVEPAAIRVEWPCALPGCSDDYESWIGLSSIVTITRMNVPDGPPRVGDVWMDDEGRQWFCVFLEQHVIARMVSTGSNVSRSWAELVNNTRLTLVYRATAPEESTVDGET